MSIRPWTVCLLGMLAARAGAEPGERVCDRGLKVSLAPLDARRIPSAQALSVTDCVRFTLAPEAEKIGGGSRAELTDPFVPRLGSSVYYRVELLVPENFPVLPESVVVAQWHDAKAKGVPSQRPPLSIRVVGRDLAVVLWNDRIWQETGGLGTGTVLLRTPYRPGRWHEFDLTIRWSADETGSVAGRMDGGPGFSHAGPVGYRADAGGSYFKFGVYTAPPFPRPLQVLHRHYQRTALD